MKHLFSYITRRPFSYILCAVLVMIYTAAISVLLNIGPALDNCVFTLAIIEIHSTVIPFLAILLVWE